MNKKKVLYVITKSNWGGAQRYVYDLAASLPKEEFEVVVALGGTGEADALAGQLQQRLEVAGVRTIFVRSFMRDISASKELNVLSELIQLYKKERPDVVHLNSSKAGGLGSLAARMAGVKKIIFTAHGWPFWEKRSAPARAAIWCVSWITVLLSHKTIVISNYDLRVARHMPFTRHKLVRIYNGINQQMNLGSGDIIRSAFPPGANITGTIGELNKNKNQRVLLEEAKNNPHMFVALVGEGEERKNLEAKIKEYGLETRVKLFGFIPAREVLQGFDRFALPSLKEGLPYVLLEARLVGLPITANRVGGVSEILDAKDLKEFSLETMVAKTIVVYDEK